VIPHILSDDWFVVFVGCDPDECRKSCIANLDRLCALAFPDLPVSQCGAQAHQKLYQ